MSKQIKRLKLKMVKWNAAEERSFMMEISFLLMEK